MMSRLGSWVVLGSVLMGASISSNSNGIRAAAQSLTDIVGIGATADKMEGAGAGFLLEGYLDDDSVAVGTRTSHAVNEKTYSPLLSKFDGKFGPRIMKLKLSRTQAKTTVSGIYQFFVRTEKRSILNVTMDFTLNDETPEMTKSMVMYILHENDRMPNDEPMVQYHVKVAALSPGSAVRVNMHEDGIVEKTDDAEIRKPADLTRTVLKDFDGKFGLRPFVLTLTLVGEGSAEISCGISAATATKGTRLSMNEADRDSSIRLDMSNHSVVTMGFTFVLSEKMATGK